MTDIEQIRKKHEADKDRYGKEAKEGFPVNEQSRLSISEVDALFRELDEARGKVEGIRGCFIWLEGTPFYKTANGVPQHIPLKIKRVLKQILKGGGE